MQKVFISHPYSSNPVENKRKVEDICKRYLVQGTLPLSPLHLFSFFPEDSPSHRKDIMQVCFHLIDIADIVVVYGDSEGCQEEAKYAAAKGKVIIFKNNCNCLTKS